jgi:hypothetical protein
MLKNGNNIPSEYLLEDKCLITNEKVMDIRISLFPKRPESRRETERPIVVEGS